MFGALALGALAIVALPGLAAADPLTRSDCWTSKIDTGATRTMCFIGSGKIKMNNYNKTSDNKGWSRCEWTGMYATTDNKVTVAFAPGSGKCSNGAVSPQWAATCNFSGDDLDCEGSSIVDGKIYEVNLTFK
jgi:hypothetical protein